MGARHSASGDRAGPSPNVELDCNNSGPSNSKQKVKRRFSAARRNTTGRFRRFFSFRRSGRRRKENSVEKENSFDKEKSVDKEMDKLTVDQPTEPIHSVCASGMVHAWKGSVKPAVKNCNVTQEQLKKDNSETGTAQFRPKSANIEELTHDVLVHIIRCFPFPSPRPSPSASPQLLPRSPDPPPRKLFSKRNNQKSSKGEETANDSLVPPTHNLQAALKNMALVS